MVLIIFHTIKIDMFVKSVIYSIQGLRLRGARDAIATLDF